MHLSGGYSGSSVQLDDGIVRKTSSYLCDCPDYAARQRFFAALSAAYPYMPPTKLLDGGILEMPYISGQEGTRGIDFYRFGQIVCQRHENVSLCSLNKLTYLPAYSLTTSGPSFPQRGNPGSQDDLPI